MTVQTHQGRAPQPEPWWLRLASFLSAALTVLVPPVVVLPGLDDAFALPKLMLAEVLALLTVSLPCSRTGQLRPVQDVLSYSSLG